ncbi:transmembrane protein 180-like isoform X1 [Acropora millepora]|uniref:transmembrane protein 180-like isoform X1 n=1 Tax=Acropora millepora TaxID=45264 RepID=UPI001CF34D40|nr:transmembrane protein 180-like isoform X1 [Acropora millepora]
MFHKSFAVRIAYGSMSLYIAILHNVFLLYYVDIFVSVYKIDRNSFWLGETIFLVWNSLNDPLFGWLSDHRALGKNQSGLSQSEIIKKRFRALMKYGPLFTLSFLSIWFHWMHPSIQFVLCLCLYDGFLTMIDLNHLALLADLALSSKDRTNLNWYCSVFSGCGSLSVFLSHHFWDRDHMGSFHVFCTLLSAFSLVGFFVSSFLLKQHFSTTKVKIDIPQEKERIEIQSTVPSADQALELKIFLKQLLTHSNFMWFAAMNLVQVFHCHFNSNFFPLFLDKLLGDSISPQTGSLLLGVSFVAPHINNLYFLALCRRFGVYSVIKWLFYVKLGLSMIMLACGPNWSILLCFYIASNRVFTEGTCKLLNLIISDLVDEDFVLHNRKQAISALIFGTAALFSKPGQTIAPLLGTWLLAEQTGYSLFYTDDLWSSSTEKRASFHDSTSDTLRWGCFYVLVFVPIVCACLQIFVWTRFKLHGGRLRWVKQMREGRWLLSSEV